ncbi:hypothetical protein DPMN_097068 [Dreissena polymorpha]|uniref:Uncharacterized protein n=1 Tax=Dreissena polymorpha TaxID=45954 RepID=A0A9D4L9L4_DREPO|nr:hypothetical protein DPMN_097068 [Dreissena polymorpha]
MCPRVETYLSVMGIVHKVHDPPREDVPQGGDLPVCHGHCAQGSRPSQRRCAPGWRPTCLSWALCTRYMTLPEKMCPRVRTYLSVMGIVHKVHDPPRVDVPQGEDLPVCHGHCAQGTRPYLRRCAPGWGPTCLSWALCTRYMTLPEKMCPRVRTYLSVMGIVHKVHDPPREDVPQGGDLPVCHGYCAQGTRPSQRRCAPGWGPTCLSWALCTRYTTLPEKMCPRVGTYLSVIGIVHKVHDPPREDVPQGGDLPVCHGHCALGT